MKIGSLFSGIGGFELAGEWAGHDTIWQSEIDPYCVQLLAERFPRSRQLGDLCAIDWSTVERPDILTGGFPCQDISYAGKGAGLKGKRSGLWFEYARAIREVGPRYVVVENVAALFTRGFDAVLGTLADLGYDAEWSMYGAADVGAPHRRHRVWVLAYPKSVGGGATLADTADDGVGRWEQLTGGSKGAWNVADANRSGRQQGNEAMARGLSEQPHGGGIQSHTDVPDTDDAGPQRGVQRIGADSEGWQEPRSGQSAECGARRTRERNGKWWAVEPNLGRVAYGVPARVDRLRGLGNAIVPACALPIFDRIAAIEASCA